MNELTASLLVLLVVVWSNAGMVVSKHNRRLARFYAFERRDYSPSFWEWYFLHLRYGPLIHFWLKSKGY